ncbi:MAG: hypothetical protein MK082_12935, partial [Phycisphaerales bacterium]|nr:hypothetical protein [Phycisphaerales bacterium]
MLARVSSFVGGMERELLGFERSPPRLVLQATSWRPDAPSAYCHHCGRGLDLILGTCSSCRGPSWPARVVVRLGAYDEPLSSWIRAVKFERWHAMASVLGVELGR